MEKVIMYKCEHCKKTFKTPNRHKCKYDPKMKNCFTCNHTKSFYEETTEGYHYDGSIATRRDVFVECALDMNCESVWDTPKNMQCKYYENCGSKWHHNQYEEYRIKKIIELHTDIDVNSVF